MASAEGVARLKRGEDEGVRVLVRHMKRADSGKYRCVLVDSAEVELRAGLGGDLSARASRGEIKDGSLLQIKAAQYHADRDICVVSSADVVLNEVKSEEYTVKVKEEPNEDVTNASPNEGAHETMSKQHVPVKKELPVVVPNEKPVEKSDSGSPVRKDTIVKVGSSMSRRVQPLQALNPYNNEWTVKVRVIAKEPMRHIMVKKENTEVSIFSMEVVDEDGTAIKVTAWRELAEKWFPLIEVGKVYFISRGLLKAADRRYSNTGNMYEMTLNKGTTVEECLDADESAMQKVLNFVPIDKLSAHIGLRGMVDVLGIVIKVGPAGSVKRKSSAEELIRRDVTLLDKSGKTVSLTLWGDLATGFGSSLEKLEFPLLAVGGVRVSDYNGVSISTNINTTVQINPPGDTREQELRDWFESEGKTLVQEGQTVDAGDGLFKRRTSLGSSSKEKEYDFLGDLDLSKVPLTLEPPHHHTVKLTIAAIKPDQPMWYLACPEPGVNNKVVEDNGRYWCEATQKHYDGFRRRYVVSMKALDSTGDGWINVFDQQATEILGITADDLSDLRDRADGSYERRIKQACWKEYVLRLSVRTEEYQDVIRKRCVVNRSSPVDFSVESRRLLRSIQQLTN